MKALRDFRIIPIVVVAVGSLAVLKVTGLLLDGGYVLNAAPQKRSWAQENLGYPGPVVDTDITGSVAAEPKPKEEMKGVSTERPAEAPGTTPENQPIPAAERAVLERLQARRQELESRAREVEIRESLLKAAEKRIEGRVEEMKGVETRITAASQQKDEADAARFKNIVTMYEGMKPRDAGKIFDRLDMAVLIEVATRMKPQKMSDVLAQMSPEAAERLTVEMARRSGADKSASTSDLPKIEGRPLPKERNEQRN